MKKIVSKVIPIACAVSTPFFISADQPTNNSTVKAVPMDKTITPPAGPVVSGRGADVYLTADFIWWKAQQDGLVFAYDGVAPPMSRDETTHQSSEQGYMHQPHFKYEPGFKLGLGVLSDHDNWDIFAQYTWLNVESSGNKNEVDYHGNNSEVDTWTDDNMLIGNQTFTTGNPDQSQYSYRDEISGKWSLNFNVLDLELGRNFWISKRLTLRPHMGMKFSWLKQDYDVHGKNAYNGFFLDFTPINSTNIDSDLHQVGVGLRGGVNAAFYMWNKWSLFGDIDWTALWNKFESSRKDSQRLSATSSKHTNAKVHYKTFTVTSVLEVAFGLRFETIFSKNRYMYMLQAGWESQVWFDQGQFINFGVPNNPGNLSLEGLTIKTGFYF